MAACLFGNDGVAEKREEEGPECVESGEERSGDPEPEGVGTDARMGCIGRFENDVLSRRESRLGAGRPRRTA